MTIKQVWELRRTDETRKIESVLQPSFYQVDAYRYNSASIRIRIIDPKFEGLHHMDRVKLIEPYLEPFPENIQRDICRLFLLTPKERNREFESGYDSGFEDFT